MNKVVKRILIISGCVLGTIVVAAGGYVGYVLLSYNRIGNVDLTIDRHSTLTQAKVGETYKAMSYNVGFGAYSQDFTFFLDTGYDEYGNPTAGHWSKAFSEETVRFNISGAIHTLKGYQPDFAFIQECDVASTRSYNINEDALLQEAFPEYDHMYCTNVHTAFLPYPFYDMHGIINGGMTTFSRFQAKDGKRRQYTVSDSLSKLFDLDRCFSHFSVEVDNGKKLHIVNSHMSAYDEGGVIRQEQMKEINAFLQTAKETGDYVVVGGDWNHDLLINNPDFDYTMANKPFGEKKKGPDWLRYLFDENGKSPILEGYSVVASDNTPTCRNVDMEWVPGKTYVCTVDGFIVSNNVEVVSHANILTKNGSKGLDGFAYSDHDPAVMEFRLKA